jgi:protein SCO1
MLRTTSLSLVLALLGWASASWLTEDFQVWTAEGARRLGVIERPVPAPAAVLAGPGITEITQITQITPPSLPTWLTATGEVTIVAFFYTRCPTVCTALGSTFEQLQQSIAPSDGVRLLTVSFDPAYDDAARLQQYASQRRADPGRWQVATVPDAAQLQRLLDAFQVVVIPDGLGGYEHNAALLIVDERGRLVRIFDVTDHDTALAYARAIARRGAAG